MSPTLTSAAMLEEALALAVNKHKGMTDKAGAPYILHPIRVMLRLAPDPTYEAQTVAVLHDLVEDTDVTLEDLRADFPETVVLAVDYLTRRTGQGESYEAFIARVARNQLAVMVKLADLADNMDVTRLEMVTEKDIERLNRYLKARKRLLSIPAPSSEGS